MAKFTVSNFRIDAGYVTYGGKFVARFKTVKGAARSFVSFLAKHFTVEEYFARLEAKEPPLAIVESRGYLLPHIKAWLKQAGLPTTREGYQQFISSRVHVRKALDA